MRKGSTGSSTPCRSGRKHLLVLAPNWIGDVVMSTPFLSVLRKRCPDDFITVLCREYVSELLVREIHKHSHVIDWYSDDILGEASAKALRTRLFDMDMYSKRLEMVFREGAYKRISLIGEMLSIQGATVKPVKITRIHLEEDAAKLTHLEAGSTQIDFNRCGVPLVEIVSEPNMSSPDEAVTYLKTLKQILEYIEICHADMEKGELRCDANISLRETGSNLMGTRTEIKNLNSFRAVARALESEIKRQTDLLNNGLQKFDRARPLPKERRMLANNGKNDAKKILKNGRGRCGRLLIALGWDRVRRLLILALAMAVTRGRLPPLWARKARCLLRKLTRKKPTQSVLRQINAS